MMKMVCCDLMNQGHVLRTRRRGIPMPALLNGIGMPFLRKITQGIFQEER